MKVRLATTPDTSTDIVAMATVITRTPKVTVTVTVMGADTDIIAMLKGI